MPLAAGLPEDLDLWRTLAPHRQLPKLLPLVFHLTVEVYDLGLEPHDLTFNEHHLVLDEGNIVLHDDQCLALLNLGVLDVLNHSEHHTLIVFDLVLSRIGLGLVRLYLMREAVDHLP